MINKIRLFFLSFLLVFFSCRPKYQERIIPPPPNEMVDVFIDATKTMIQDEERMIDSLLLLSNIDFHKDSISCMTLHNAI